MITIKINKFRKNKSRKITSSGATVHIIEVLALPPRAGWSMRVSLLSRYGMCALKRWSYFR